MSISLLSEALDIEKYVAGVVEVRVRVGIVDTSSAISGCGRGVRRQESRVMEKVRVHSTHDDDKSLARRGRGSPHRQALRRGEKFTRTNQIKKSLFASIWLESLRDLRVHR